MECPRTGINAKSQSHASLNIVTSGMMLFNNSSRSFRYLCCYSVPRGTSEKQRCEQAIRAWTLEVCLHLIFAEAARVYVS
jgi:hypothetical protein